VPFFRLISGMKTTQAVRRQAIVDIRLSRQVVKFQSEVFFRKRAQKPRAKEPPPGTGLGAEGRGPGVWLVPLRPYHGVWLVPRRSLRPAVHSFESNPQLYASTHTH
jgi:hypothetical protein